jgi:hypothetical protein
MILIDFTMRWNRFQCILNKKNIEDNFIILCKPINNDLLLPLVFIDTLLTVSTLYPQEPGLLTLNILLI